MIEAELEDMLFAVEDDGPGVADDALMQLAERGVRMDESVGGHGLGLAIAKEVVTQYGGEATFGRSPRLGGFMVRVRIPAVRRNSA